MRPKRISPCHTRSFQAVQLFSDISLSRCLGTRSSQRFFFFQNLGQVSRAFQAFQVRKGWRFLLDKSRVSGSICMCRCLKRWYMKMYEACLHQIQNRHHVSTLLSKVFRLATIPGGHHQVARMLCTRSNSGMRKQINSCRLESYENFRLFVNWRLSASTEGMAKGGWDMDGYGSFD